MNDITRLLREMEQGRSNASDELLRHVYDELRISVRTAKRDWAYARAWLGNEFERPRE